MPVPPKTLKGQVEDDVDSAAWQRWPQLEEATVRWRGSYGYLRGHLTDDDDDGIPLARIEYLGGTTWAIAIYDPATDSYTDTILPTGERTGTPEQALDLAAHIHLTDTENDRT